jgi:eukaryotic-like serine/threonine-protein kinase
MTDQPKPDRPGNIDDTEDTDALMPVAERIAKSEPVDWHAETQRVDKADPTMSAQLQALRDIAAVEAAHREAERSMDRLDRQPAGDVPRHWRHLTLLEKIGEGQFGEVYRAFDNTLQIEVALKLSHPGTETATDLSSALHEARMLARIQHPNVVRVYGAEVSEGRSGIWMELVRGRALKDILTTQRFSAAEAVNIGIELCRALAAVHQGGVLHGDIKAHNVIRRDNGDIVLVDLGAGRRLSSPPRGRDVVGTPVYMAPEVLRGAPRSPASDIYSLGVLLFHLVTDAYPVFATSTGEALAIHDTDQHKRLRDLRPDLPTSFIAIVERATAADPRARYASAGAMEAALRAGPDRAPAPPARVPRALVAIGAVALVAMVAFVGQRLWTSSADRGSILNGPRPEATPRTPEVKVIPTESVPFDIDAAFYRMTPNGRERLDMGQQVHVDDELSLSFQASAPTYLYVVNEDEKGKSFLLFPLPDAREGTNPIPGNQETRVPKSGSWQVNSAGGREHFLVFASATRLEAFDSLFAKLPSPQAAGTAEREQSIPDAVREKLRGVGAMKAPPSPPETKPSLNLRDLFQTPLQGHETARGLWVRQLTLINGS